MSRLGTLPPGRRPLRLALCLLAVVTLAGACTSSPPPAPTVPRNPDAVAPDLAGTKPGKAPAPADRCHESGNEPAAKVVLTTSDKVHLAGVRFGTGAKGVLLLPQNGADLCPWWSYASELLNQGFLVLAIDLRGTGFSEVGTTKDYTADAAAGVAALKADGAKRVVIIGASLGAATALVTAGRIADQVAGIVSLSYPDDNLDVTGGTGKEPHTPIQAAGLITVPMMVCFTAGDKLGAPRPEDIVDAAHTAVKQLVGRPGVSHGWDMLKVGDDDVRPDLLKFLKSYA